MAVYYGKSRNLGCTEPVEGQPDIKGQILASGFDRLSPTD
jgi:hypothetical protein